MSPATTKAGSSIRQELGMVSQCPFVGLVGKGWLGLL